MLWYTLIVLSKKSKLDPILLNRFRIRSIVEVYCMITYFDCMNVQMLLLEWIRMVVELKAEEENLNDIEELTHNEKPIEDKSQM